MNVPFLAVVGPELSLHFKHVDDDNVPASPFKAPGTRRATGPKTRDWDGGHIDLDGLKDKAFSRHS